MPKAGNRRRRQEQVDVDKLAGAQSRRRQSRIRVAVEPEGKVMPVIALNAGVPASLPAIAVSRTRFDGIVAVTTKALVAPPTRFEKV